MVKTTQTVDWPIPVHLVTRANKSHGYTGITIAQKLTNYTLPAILDLQGSITLHIHISMVDIVHFFLPLEQSP
jgi:hypothetical protein